MLSLRAAFWTALPLAAASVAACGTDVAVQTGATTGAATSASSVAASSSSAGGADTTSTSSAGGSGGAGGMGGADIGQPSTNYPGPHGVPPQVVTYGGPVLKAPKLVPVFFADYDPMYKKQLTDFANQLGSTKYFAATTSEYGVGPATSLAAISLTENAPASIDDSGIQAWLAGKLNGDDPAWPAADANTLYILHYPASTSISLGGQQSCQTFGAYHSNTTLDAMHGTIDVAYAVIPVCSFPNMSGIDEITSSESHEIIEAATDPFPMTNPAFATVDEQHFYWSRVLGGGENGDMCAQFQDSFTTFAELPFMVQRGWSNKAAKAGTDPCVPELPGEVYFNAAPVMKDNVQVMTMGQTITYKGVNIPVGQSKVVELDLFSEGDTGGPWDVDIKDFSSLIGGPELLTFSLDASKGQNGQKLHATVTVKMAGKRGTETFLVHSTQGTTKHTWIGVIGSK